MKEKLVALYTAAKAKVVALYTSLKASAVAAVASLDKKSLIVGAIAGFILRSLI